MVVCLLTFGNTKFTLPYLAASFAAFDDQPPETIQMFYFS